jgi:2-hydroxy-3-oxopropionate reductase
VNQILVAQHIHAMGEAFMLAAKAGVDFMKVFEAVKGGLAGSHVLNAKAPLLAERNFKPGFRIELHQKDLKNALEAADAYGLNLPITVRIQEFITDLVANGHGGDDHGGIVQAIEMLNDSRITRKE